MIRYPRVVWGDPDGIKFKVLVGGEDRETQHDEECTISRQLAFSLAIDLLRALLFGERE